MLIAAIPTEWVVETCSWNLRMPSSFPSAQCKREQSYHNLDIGTVLSEPCKACEGDLADVQGGAMSPYLTPTHPLGPQCQQ